MNRDEFRPDSVLARDHALRVLRSGGTRLGVKRGLLYGLALEDAADNEEEFLAYVRAELDTDDATDSSSSGGTQQAH